MYYSGFRYSTATIMTKRLRFPDDGEELVLHGKKRLKGDSDLAKALKEVDRRRFALDNCDAADVEWFSCELASAERAYERLRAHQKAALRFWDLVERFTTFGESHVPCCRLPAKHAAWHKFYTSERLGCPTCFEAEGSHFAILKHTDTPAGFCFERIPAPSGDKSGFEIGPDHLLISRACSECASRLKCSMYNLAGTLKALQRSSLCHLASFVMSFLVIPARQYDCFLCTECI